MKKNIRLMISAAVFAAVGFTGSQTGVSYAADQVYNLNPVVVTATRTVKQDLTVPASATVITAKDIKDKGYVSVFECC